MSHDTGLYLVLCKKQTVYSFVSLLFMEYFKITICKMFTNSFELLINVSPRHMLFRTLPNDEVSEVVWRKDYRKLCNFSNLKDKTVIKEKLNFPYFCLFELKKK